MRQSFKLSADGILKYLGGSGSRFDITVYKTIDSTNTYAKALAKKGAEEGTVIASRHQSQGRGRLGRSFYSPDGTGLYMSLILRPQINPQETLLITTAAAVAAAQAIESVSGRQAQIKWVNDVLCDGKKVCGILTEASLKDENAVDFVILGIGVNLKEPEGGFPHDIENTAGAIFKENTQQDAADRLASEILKNFMQFYEQLGAREFFPEYKRRSLVLGKSVTVKSTKGDFTAKAVDIEDDCSLRVKLGDGSEKLLSSGEVSVVL